MSAANIGSEGGRSRRRGVHPGVGRLGRSIGAGAVRVPTLVIHADRSMNGPETLSDLWTTLDNADTPGVVHFNQLLAAGEVNRLIEDFVALAAPAG